MRLSVKVFYKLILFCILSLVLSAGCGSGGGGGGSGGDVKGPITTKSFTDNDGNTYEITGETALVEGITLTNDTSISPYDVLSSGQTPLTSSFIKITSPAQTQKSVSTQKAISEQAADSCDQEGSIIDVKISLLSTVPDKILITTPATLGVIAYEPFSTDPSGNTFLRFSAVAGDGSISTSFLPIQDTDSSKSAKAFDILQQNDGHVLKIKVAPELKVDRYRYYKGCGDSSTPIPLISNTITINVDSDIAISGVYTFELIENKPAGIVVWRQDVLVQKPADFETAATGGRALNDGSIAFLANRFAPILAYNDNEKYYPSSLEYIFTEAENTFDFTDMTVDISTIWGG